MSGAAGRAAASNIRSTGVSNSDLKELVGTNPEKRNWKGIIIAILVILIVFALIAIAVVLTSPEKRERRQGAEFTFEDMFDPAYISKTFDAKWLKDEDAFIYKSREGEILLYNVTNHSTSVIMDNSTFRLYDTGVYFVSPDLQYVLIAFNMEKVFRHSYVAEYVIFDRQATDPSSQIIEFPHDRNELWKNRKLQFAGWSSTGHSLTFVYENNIYHQENPVNTPTQITDSGSDTLYNGIPDWLYEEEIFHTHVSHWWSTDSTYICYTQIDDTYVPLYTMPWYSDQAEMYNNFISVAYPKAGDIRMDVNPVIKLKIVKTKDFSQNHIVLQPPQLYQDSEHYVKSVHWQNDTSLLIVWANRAQNHSIVTTCTFPFTRCRESVTQKSTGGWVSISPIMSINSGSAYLTLLPALEGHSGHWKHIAMVKGNKIGFKTFVTQGAFDVLDILGFRQSTQTVFYAGNDGDPRKRHIFSVDIPGANGKKHTPKCITCDMGQSRQYVSGRFGSSGNYYILHCQGPGVPQYILKSTSDDSLNTTLEDNRLLADILGTKSLPEEEMFSIKSNDGQDIWIKLSLPPLLNKDHITLYPLLIHTYAGPGSQMVTYRFKLDWGTYLSSTHNIIYAHVDGHGSAGRGEKWLNSIYKHLGTLEVQDQIRAAEYLKDLPFVDHERIGIWGWSYGGFVTAHALGDDRSDVFDCGISVAPVTDFRYYDTAYTERYLGLLRDMENLSGYEATNVSAKAQYFAGRQYMIVHGTADDNVHYQNTAQFVRALTESEIDFHMQVYTDLGHSLSGLHSSRHLYKTMTHFIRDTCWDGGNPREIRKGKYIEVDIQQLAIR